jgi:integrase
MAFLLGLFAGLRRSEIDRLRWDHIDHHKRRVQVVPSTTKKTKTSASEGSVLVSATVLNELADLQKKTASEWVVEETNYPGTSVHRDARYRANGTEMFLVQWLRGKGITRKNPLHELRKEFGSIINEKDGLLAASHALRHASYLTTAAIYVENRSTAVADLAEYRSHAQTELVGA